MGGQSSSCKEQCAGPCEVVVLSDNCVAQLEKKIGGSLSDAEAQSMLKERMDEQWLKRMQNSSDRHTRQLGLTMDNFDRLSKSVKVGFKSRGISTELKEEEDKILEICKECVDKPLCCLEETTAYRQKVCEVTKKIAACNAKGKQ